MAAAEADASFSGRISERSVRPPVLQKAEDWQTFKNEWKVYERECPDETKRVKPWLQVSTFAMDQMLEKQRNFQESALLRPKLKSRRLFYGQTR
jgi:hypothetical protein